MKWTRIALLALLAACASAGSEDDDNGPPDAANFSFPDATPLPDSGPVPDGAIVYDAASQGEDGGGDPLLCDESSECASDKCCLLGFCVDGQEILGECIPDL